MGLCSSKEEVYAEEDKALILEEARKKFAKFDVDNSGEIEVAELGALIHDVTGQRMTPLELQEAVKVLDKDGGGTIGWREFRQWFLSDEDDEQAVLGVSQREAEARAAAEEESAEEAEAEAEAELADEEAAAVVAEEEAEAAEDRGADLQAEEAAAEDAAAEAASAAAAAAASEQAAADQLQAAAKELDSSDEEAVKPVDSSDEEADNI